MKFGLMFTNTGMGSSAAGAIDLATRAERLGFESLWTVEHVVVPSGYQSAYPYHPSGKMAGGLEEFDLPDPLIWLAYVAVADRAHPPGDGDPHRPAAQPGGAGQGGRHASTRCRGGRVTLGVGVGWLEEEFDALGVPFNDRGRRLDDYVSTMRALWAGGKTSVHSEFTSFEQCISLPRPATGTVPIVIGGHSPAAARRAGRLGDGFFPGNGKVDELAGVFDMFRGRVRRRRARPGRRRAERRRRWSLVRRHRQARRRARGVGRRAGDPVAVAGRPARRAGRVAGRPLRHGRVGRVASARDRNRSGHGRQVAGLAASGRCCQPPNAAATTGSGNGRFDAVDRIRPHR